MANADHAEAEVNSLRQQVSELWAQFPELRESWEAELRRIDLLKVWHPTDRAKRFLAEIFPVREV